MPEPSSSKPADASVDASVAADEGTPRPNMFGPLGRPLIRGPFYVGFVGAIGALVAWYGMQTLLGAVNILVLIFVAAFLAVGLNPIVTRLQRRGMPRGLAVATVGIVGILVFCGGLFALVPPLVGQVGDFVERLPGLLDDLNRNRLIRDLNERYDLIERAKSVLTAQNLTTALGGVLGGVSLVFGTIFNVLTVLILTVYFLVAFDRLRTGAYKLVPASRRERVQLLGDEMLQKVGGYIAGALFIAFCAGASSLIFMLIVGIAYPIALAIIVAIFDLIPQIGATLGAVVVILVGFAASVPVGIAAVIFFLAYQQVENWIIYPRVMGKAVRVTDLAAILSALLGAALLGIVGTLIAIPAVAAAQLIVREVVIPRQDSR